jgi:putative restriction endonuclease
MPHDLVAFLRNGESRKRARDRLISNYFRPSEGIALYELAGLPVPSRREIEENAAYRSPEEAVKKGREGRFRLQVVSAYNYACALTGYRLTTITAGSIVDAAHIHEFRDSRNNDPRNGLALSKNAHWTFDQGLWTVSDDYRVVVAIGRFVESGPNRCELLEERHGKTLCLPKERRLWPDPRYLSWHRRVKFKAV